MCIAFWRYIFQDLYKQVCYRLLQGKQIHETDVYEDDGKYNAINGYWIINC